MYNILFHIFATELLSNLENRYQGCNKDFSRGGGSHCVKVRVLTECHVVFATCCRLLT